MFFALKIRRDYGMSELIQGHWVGRGYGQICHLQSG